MFAEMSPGKNLISTRGMDFRVCHLMQPNSKPHATAYEYANAFGFRIFNFVFHIRRSHEWRRIHWISPPILSLSLSLGWFIAVYTETDDHSFITDAICPRSDKEIAFRLPLNDPHFCHSISESGFWSALVECILPTINHSEMSRNNC